MKNHSKFSDAKRWAVMGATFFATVSSLAAAYAAFSTLSAATGETLTKDKWNEMIQYVVPPGAVVAFNGNSCPAGWDLADGTNDPAVWWGTNAMDLRGRFVRGSDPSGSNDTDFALRSGGSGTNKVGSVQGDVLGSHNHKSVNAGNLSHRVGITGGPNDAWFADGWDGWFVTSTTGGSETRPKNVAAIFCIKQ